MIGPDAQSPDGRVLDAPAGAENSTALEEGSSCEAGRLCPATERAASLIGLFFEDGSLFGRVHEVAVGQVPEPFRTLLDHRGHMTVAMEEFLGGPVGLRVIRERRENRPADAKAPLGKPVYSREIMLLAASGHPVQYGIVRINLAAVPGEARSAIEQGSVPLGRILIESGTLRDVHDVSLVQVTAGGDLAGKIGKQPGSLLYGRVAGISLAGTSGAGHPGKPGPSTAAARPVIELLEIPLVERTVVK